MSETQMVELEKGTYRFAGQVFDVDESEGPLLTLRNVKVDGRDMGGELHLVGNQEWCDDGYCMLSEVEFDADFDGRIARNPRKVERDVDAEYRATIVRLMALFGITWEEALDMLGRERGEELCIHQLASVVFSHAKACWELAERELHLAAKLWDELGFSEDAA